MKILKQLLLSEGRITLSVILHDGKLGGGWYLIRVRDVTVKKFNEVFLYNSRKYCIYGMRNPKQHVL